MILTWILLSYYVEKSQANYTIKNINGKIFLEEEGKAHLYHEKWKLAISINTTNAQQV